MHLISAALKYYYNDLTEQWRNFYIFNYLEHKIIIEIFYGK